jgi:hypothetical protein
MKIKTIKILPENTLIYQRVKLVDTQNHLTKKGAENFLGVLSTLMVNYTNEKGIDWLLKNFDLTLKNRFSLTSVFRVYMMSLLDHKLSTEQRNILIDGLMSVSFNKNLILDESLHDWLEENIIDEISIYRNIELGEVLIRDSSNFLSFQANISFTSAKEVLSKVPIGDFEQKIAYHIQKKIPSEKPGAIAIKMFIYNSLKYNHNPKEYPEVLVLKFALDLKQNLLFYEKNFSRMKDCYKEIIHSLNKEYGKNKGRNHNKGLNR